MALDWFKMYGEWSNDPKVQSMPEAMQRRLVMLFCEHSNETVTSVTETDRAFHWRITEEQLAETKKLFIAKGFMDDRWNLRQWEPRQKAQGVSTKRVREWREKRKHDVTPVTVTVTQHETHETGRVDKKRLEEIRREEIVPKPTDPTPEEIVCAHPAAVSRGMKPLQVPHSLLAAVVDVLAAGEPADALLAKVKAIAAVVAEWPPGEMKFLSRTDRFFREREFNKPLEEWRLGKKEREVRWQPGLAATPEAVPDTSAEDLAYFERKRRQA